VPKHAVIARVPFDEGSLTGTLTRDSRWPDGDWRNSYFTPKTLADTLDRVERLLLPGGHGPGQSLRSGSFSSIRPSARRFPACVGRTMSTRP
jgi:hypothetical protein